MTVDDAAAQSEAVVRRPGPWTHRDVSANGARFHVVEAGDGPLVVLLHGFPTFWWTWRHLLPVLADAGFRAVAIDLRGYGGSDHTPHGYDPFTLSADVAGVIGSLGQADAVVVGHGWGGLVAWSMAVLEPDVVRAIVPVAVPHPRRLRAAILRRPGQLRRSSYAVGLQWPFLPERSLARDDAARVEWLLRAWSGTPGWPDDETASTYRAAMLLGSTTHTSVEYHRWALRSVARPDGLRYARAMRTPVDVSVLHVHGGSDPTILAASMVGSQRWVAGSYRLEVLDGLGHFPHEEAPDRFAGTLLPWLETEDR
ncbi:MAG: alpha/beta hydrolase [Actinomycetota bacterium]|nr:MAG: alpha/beta hydrolase [Actinomycetota bacterium]